MLMRYHHALASFAKRNGRNRWRERLRLAWMDGNYRRWGSDTTEASALQAIRNHPSYGPGSGFIEKFRAAKGPTMKPAGKIEALKDIAADIGGRFHTYSGRGMYGKECVSIYVDDDGTTCIERASAAGITGAHRDSMGRGSVVYWPRISAEDAIRAARSVSLHLSQCIQLERDGKTPPGWTDRQARDYLVARALQEARRLCDEALPKFNWAASVLDANAIRLLNETPRLIELALSKG